MAAIPERVWALLTPDEQTRLREICDGWRHEPRIVCPCCGSQLGVRLRISAGAISLDATGDGIPDDVAPKPFVQDVNTQQLAEAERALIESAERSGLMKAFVRAVHEAKNGSGIPADMNRYFLQFFRSAVVKKVPRFVIDRFNREFSGNFTFWSSQGVLAVSVDGVIRMFVPLSFVVGPPVTSITTKKMGGRLQSDGNDLEIWIKGRFGYVPLHSENYMDAMKQKNIGKFGALVQ